MLIPRYLWFALASLLIAYDASAVSFDSQSRTLDARADVVLVGFAPDSDSDFDSAPGIGPYSAQVSALASVSAEFAIATADQDTSLMVMAGSIWGDGAGAAAASFDLFDPGSPSEAGASSASVYSVTFTVPNSTFFTLTYGLSASLDTFGGVANLLPEALWLLEGANQGPIDSDFAEDLLADGNGVSVSDFRSGLLAPDTYTFSIGAFASDGIAAQEGFASGGSDYSFELHVPEPSTGLLLGLGLGLLGIPLRRRRGRNKRTGG